MFIANHRPLQRSTFMGEAETHPHLPGVHILFNVYNEKERKSHAVSEEPGGLMHCPEMVRGPYGSSPLCSKGGLPQSRGVSWGIALDGT